MRVLLVNEAEYELNEGKMTKMPFEMFNLMRDRRNITKSDDLRRVRVFKSMEEFNSTVTDKDINTFDETKEVLVSKGGNIFLFLKDTTYNSESGTDNVTANPEENQAE